MTEVHNHAGVLDLAGLEVDRVDHEFEQAAGSEFDASRLVTGIIERLLTDDAEAVNEETESISMIIQAILFEMAAAIPIKIREFKASFDKVEDLDVNDPRWDALFKASSIARDGTPSKILFITSDFGVCRNIVC